MIMYLYSSLRESVVNRQEMQALSILLPAAVRVWETLPLLETIMVASEAKAEALQAMDLPMTGTPTDAVIARM